MSKRKDLLLLVCALALIGACYGVFRLTQGRSVSKGLVRITVDGALYAEAPLGVERDIEIAQPNGETNTLHVTAHGFFMAYSTCQNQLCVHQGAVTEENYTQRALGNRVICLPNRVLAELVLENVTPPPDAPDI